MRTRFLVMVVAALRLLSGCDRVFGVEGHDDTPRDAQLDSPSDTRTTTDSLPPPSDGLLAYWTMDNVTPTGIVHDETGRGHDGTCVTCPTIVSGQVGEALHFDGSGDFVRIDGSGELRTDQAFTVMLWVHPESEDGCAVSKVFGMASDNSWQMCVTGFTTANFDSLDGSRDLSVGAAFRSDSWTNVALIWDGTSNILLVDAAESDTTPADVSFDDGAILIGLDFDGGHTAVPFLGDIDDVRIYDRALTKQQVADIAGIGN